MYGDPNFMSRANPFTSGSQTGGATPEQRRQARAGGNSGLLSSIVASAGTALNQQGGQTQSQGMQLSVPSTPQISMPQTQVSASVIRTANPKTPLQTIQKLEANNALNVPQGLAVEAAPIVIKAIKKGADPKQAYRALSSEPAVIVAKCKAYIKNLPMKAQAHFKAVKEKCNTQLAYIKLLEQQILTISKEIQLLSIQNAPDLMMKAKSSLDKLVTEQTMAIAELTEKIGGFDTKSAETCLIDLARAEGALEFEAIIGSDIKTPQQKVEEELVKDAEIVVAETDGAAILAEAATEDADLFDEMDAPTGETASDELVEAPKQKMKMDEYLTPQNLLIGGLALGALYLILRD